MTYTADFLIARNVGDMFQSFNGDVWIVIETFGHRIASDGKILYRATVKRIAINKGN